MCDVPSEGWRVRPWGALMVEVRELEVDLQTVGSPGVSKPVFESSVVDTEDSGK